jgi:hypothetical protein
MSGVKYNLNHIYAQAIGNENIAIGASETVEVVDFVLFEKSLALTGDLKRLPVIRSISIEVNYGVLWAGQLAGTGQNTIRAECCVFNKEFTEAELEAIFTAAEMYDPKNDILWSNYKMAHYEAANNIGFVQQGCSVWPFKGGVLAKNQLTISLQTEIPANAAGADFDADTITAIVFFEIDWVPVSANEFKEFILESVYAGE